MLIVPLRVISKLLKLLLKNDLSILKQIVGQTMILTLIYPAHFEDVPRQSGVNYIFEG